MDVTIVLANSKCFFNVHVRNKEEFFPQMVKLILESDWDLKAYPLLESFQKREKESSTSIGKGIAVPHCRLTEFKGIRVYFFQLQQPIDFDSEDNEKVRFITAIISGKEFVNQYLKTLTMLVRTFNSDELRNKAFNAQTKEELIALFAQNGDVLQDS